jgi:hypothetical protein
MARTIDRAKEAWWRRALERFPRSGLSIRAFCAQQGITEHSFYRWRRVLAERDGQGSGAEPTLPLFVPVTVEPEPAGSVLEVVLPRGVRVCVRPGCDAALLAQVLTVLEGRSC